MPSNKKNLNETANTDKATIEARANTSSPTYIKNIKKIGLIAGSGIMPQQVFDACTQEGIECKVLKIQDNLEEKNFPKTNIEVFSPYSVSKIIKYLKKENITNIIFAGRIKRRSLSRLLLDPKGAELLALIIKNGISDNTLLTTIMSFFEKEGFTVIPPDKIAKDIIIEKGILNKKVKISKDSHLDIKKGFQILEEIAKHDVGQALVIQDGLILGVEAAEGTDELIKRCGNIKQEGNNPPILIKACKPNQDTRIDLPCIGSTTIKKLAEYGFAGVAMQANVSLILDKEQTIKLADQYNIFVLGV